MAPGFDPFPRLKIEVILARSTTPSRGPPEVSGPATEAALFAKGRVTGPLEVESDGSLVFLTQLQELECYLK